MLLFSFCHLSVLPKRKIISMIVASGCNSCKNFLKPLSVQLWFVAHFDVEEPWFESVHLTGSFAEVVHHQVEGSGCQKVRLRAAEVLTTCGAEGAQSQQDLRTTSFQTDKPVDLVILYNTFYFCSSVFRCRLT